MKITIHVLLFVVIVFFLVGCGADTEKILDRTWEAMNGAQQQTNAVSLRLVDVNENLTNHILDQNDLLIRQQIIHENNIVGIASFSQLLAGGVIFVVIVMFVFGLRRSREMRDEHYLPPQSDVRVIHGGKPARSIAVSRKHEIVSSEYDN